MKRKKILSIVMALILSLCSFPLTEVQAEEAFPEGETLEKNRTEELEKSVQEITPQTGNVRTANNIWEEYRYRELEDGTLEITGYQGNDTELVIPAEINGKRVTSIGSYAFDGCSSLTGIELPAGITSIGVNAFSGCRSLTEIKLPESLTIIGDYAFGELKDMELLVYKNSYAEKYAKQYKYSYKYIFHAWDTAIVKATTKKNGSITKTCTECAKQTTETIYAVKNIKLSQTSYTYNGKSQKPSVTVKDRKGKALKNKKDYTITYPKNMKNVGNYTVTIKLKGNYKGTVKKTFQIIPKGTTISKITPKKKGFALKWNKQAVQTTGYEVAYSTNKDFTKRATGTITVGKSKTVSKSVSKLKAKKKYYVKIRTYKAVKINGKTKKLYSAWSKIKTVITK